MQLFCICAILKTIYFIFRVLFYLFEFFSFTSDAGWLLFKFSSFFSWFLFALNLFNCNHLLTLNPFKCSHWFACRQLFSIALHFSGIFSVDFSHFFLQFSFFICIFQLKAYEMEKHYIFIHHFQMLMHEFIHRLHTYHNSYESASIKTKTIIFCLYNVYGFFNI